MRRDILIRAVAGWLLFGFVAAPLLLAQDEGAERLTPEERLERQLQKPRLGLYGQLGLNMHSGNFQGLPEAPACLELDGAGFGGDMGFGFGIGALYEMWFGKQWSLQGRIGYSSMGATLRTEANIGPILVGDSDTASGISEYSLDAGLGAIAGAVTVGYRPFEFPLTFQLGPEVGFFMQKTFTQQEELLEPFSASFIAADGSKSRIRNSTSDDIANTGLQISANVGVDYELPMNEEGTLLLVPELRYSFPFTKVRSDLDWKIHQVRLGAALKYSFPIPKPQPPLPPTEEPTQPPPPPPQPMLAADLSLVGVGRDGVERDVLKITVEEFINTQTHALLNYIFFDENSSTIPARYVQYGGDASNQFRFDMLRDQGTMAVYHQILNILGARMKEEPGISMTLTGTNSNEGVEKGNRDLSKARAESVRDYLTSAWGIDGNRISVRDRNLPTLPSNTDEADGNQENRRVEITANRDALLEPVTTDDTLRTVDPPGLRVKSSYTAEAGIEDWSLQLRQGAELKKEFTGTDEIPESLDWDIEGNPMEIPRQQSPITAVLSVRDSEGQTTTGIARLPVEQITIRRKKEERMGDFVFDRFNLITFEYNSAKLSKASRKIAKDIRNRIKPESEVEIVGYSDRLGDEEHNMKLSNERAQNTARELNVALENASGAGENTELYNNDLPEGRFYTRTVDINIKTPVQRGASEEE